MINNNMIFLSKFYDVIHDGPISENFLKKKTKILFMSSFRFQVNFLRKFASFKVRKLNSSPNAS